MGEYKLGYNKKTKKTEREHRLIAGTKPNDGKDVHHKNGNKNDNRKSNLKPMDHGKHTAITNTETHTKNIKCSINGCGRKHYALGKCKMHYEILRRKGKK